MADFAALPLFTDALLADTGHLDDAEFGRYMRLLIVTWRSPGCRIPSDRAWISKRLHMTPLQFEGAIKPLLDEFFTTDGNWHMQKRLMKEFLYVQKRTKRQSHAAKSRWINEKDVCHGNAPTPSPSPSLKKEEKEHTSYVPKTTPKGKPAASKRGTRLPDDWVLEEEWGVWAVKNTALSGEAVLKMADKFKDYWIARAGNGGVKADWFATWRNWVREQLEREGKKR